ncbi:HPr family phosphocarrier protein [Caloramator australicus]|uniref:Phosphocarrier protein HPr n=1 Tax=Caloramator australicus RC3 TaxID=857293 RepID=I7KTP6_9CLOT|nr:HPr family phosphocarrier protein [Caloramator australicus]CCJ33193.1 Phosphotransferase system, phosphocarrier protein HPr [Caloramator australicus RC3]
MKKITVKVNNPTGLHARPASLLVKEASKFKSSIFLTKNNKDFNAKSIINVMAMGAVNGDEIILKVEGEDEDIALISIKNFIEGFEE